MMAEMMEAMYRRGKNERFFSIIEFSNLFLPGREKVMWELLWLALSGFALI